MYEYTFEDFEKSYLKDKEIFGEDARYLYEDLFSTISGKKISLEGVDDYIETINETRAEDANMLDHRGAATGTVGSGSMDNFANEFRNISANAAGSNDALKAAADISATPDGTVGAVNAVAQAANTGAGIKAARQVLNNFSNYLKQGGTATKAVAMKGLDGISNFLADPKAGFAKAGSGILGFFKSLPGRIKNFFGGMKGMGFTDILKKGWGWIANPAHMPILLGCTGGVLLLSILIKSAKKRRQQKLMAQLQSAQASMKTAANKAKSGQIDEEDDKLVSIYARILQECEENDNVLLRNAIFGEVKKDVKPNYFVY